MSSNASYRL
jgi:hypothetical protein